MKDLLFAVVVVIAIAQTALVWYIDSTTPNSQFWPRAFTFSAGVGGAAIWWALFARVAERQFQRAARTQLRAQQAASIEQLRGQRMATEQAESELIAVLQEELRAQRYVLMSEVAMLETPSDIYSRHLTRDLERTKRYAFRGPTGIYVGARLQLRQSASDIDSVEVIMIDPRSQVAMQQVTGDRAGKTDHSAKDLTSIEEGIRQDLALAIVAIFDAKNQVREVAIGHDPGRVIKRTELFSDAMYDARIAVPGKDNFPRTGRWESTQPIFGRVVEEFSAHLERLALRRRYQARDRDDAIVDHLNELGLRTDLSQLRADYDRQYVQPLRAAVEQARNFTEEESTPLG